ncbi:MAG: Leucine-responsive regulatory protein [Candidatus Celerinatantimonas neptuna]|nr:MAG: Leucine-responsive regulatory protein [Candidatus Celerinatantimonas neptuna]
MKSLDKIYIAILDRLQRDGRLSNAKLSANLALSESPCWRRVKRLEEEQYIQGYQANMNRQKLGFGVLAFVHITCVKHDLKTTKQFESIIHAADNVLSCHNTTGDSDFMLQVIAKDLDDYSRFVEHVLRQLPGISVISSYVSLREIKSSPRFPITLI